MLWFFTTSINAILKRSSDKANDQNKIYLFLLWGQWFEKSLLEWTNRSTGRNQNLCTSSPCNLKLNHWVGNTLIKRINHIQRLGFPSRQWANSLIYLITLSISVGILHRHKMRLESHFNTGVHIRASVWTGHAKTCHLNWIKELFLSHTVRIMINQFNGKTGTESKKKLERRASFFECGEWWDNDVYSAVFL